MTLTCFRPQRVEAQDALDKYEVAKQYKTHIEAVASDRHLESWFQDSSFAWHVFACHVDCHRRAHH